MRHNFDTFSPQTYTNPGRFNVIISKRLLCAIQKNILHLLPAKFSFFTVFDGMIAYLIIFDKFNQVFIQFSASDL